MRLTWRKQVNKSFRRLPDGAGLYVDGERVASVQPMTATRLGGDACGWMWPAPTNERLGIEFRNTHAAPVATILDAKAQCEAYIRECLGVARRKKR